MKGLRLPDTTTWLTSVGKSVGRMLFEIEEKKQK